MGSSGVMGGHYLCFGVVLIGIGTTFYCISLATPDWISGQVHNRSLRLGLWQTCLDDVCVGVHEDGNNLMHTLGSWLEFCEAFASIGFAICCIAIILTGVYLLVANYTLLKVTAFVLFFSSLFYATSMVIFSIESYKKGLVGNKVTASPLAFSTSVYMGALGVICGTLAGALYLVDYYRSSYQRQGYMKIN